MAEPHATHAVIVAPASACEPADLAAGVDRLVSAGWSVDQVDRAGDDADARAAAFWAAAHHDAPVVWAARGGYGCTHLLPRLAELTESHGPPPLKFLAGYSDLTALFPFVARRWGWRCVHANMPGTGDFARFAEDQFRATLAVVGGLTPPDLFDAFPLRHVAGPMPADPVRGPVIGGTLAVFNYATGTPEAAQPIDAAARPILFLEDVGEPSHKLDAFARQLGDAGRLGRLGAVVLGGFDGCGDPAVPGTGIAAMVAALAPHAARVGFPVWAGLPVTHGPDAFWPLPLFTPAELTPAGVLRFPA